MSPIYDDIVTRDVLLRVAELLKWNTANYITPVCRNITNDEGELVGSATFVRLNGYPYLLTNEHVARARLQHTLSHFSGLDDRSVYRIIHPFYCLTYPTDAAFTRIDDLIEKKISRDFVSSACWETDYHPSDGEILFIHGYPGRNSHFSAIASGLLTRTLPFATPAVPLPPLPDKYDPDMHFAISFPRDIKMMDFNGRPADLPDPRGMSGSIVWDSRYVRLAKQDVQWCPQHAKPCGLIYAWEPDYDCLVGTKIQYVRAFLLQALRMEAAYFNWINRGKPENDALTDWIHAENIIETI
jgi:hypothetical protein